MPSHQVDVGAATKAGMVTSSDAVDCERNGNILILGKTLTIRRLRRRLRGAVSILSKHELDILVHLIWHSDDTDEIKKYAEELSKDTSPCDMGDELHFVTYFSTARLHLFITPGSPVCDFSLYSIVPLLPGSDPTTQVYIAGKFDSRTKVCELTNCGWRMVLSLNDLQQTRSTTSSFGCGVASKETSASKQANAGFFTTIPFDELYQTTDIWWVEVIDGYATIWGDSVFFGDLCDATNFACHKSSVGATNKHASSRGDVYAWNYATLLGLQPPTHVTSRVRIKHLSNQFRHVVLPFAGRSGSCL
jgi:hypothetical protein